MNFLTTIVRTVGVLYARDAQGCPEAGSVRNNQRNALRRPQRTESQYRTVQTNGTRNRQLLHDREFG
ncbi:hypothetical protein T06_16462 [Trichinella sp. T6]|nr:hypothetical protein T06_16462 [Trichinella sp. T6]